MRIEKQPDLTGSMSVMAYDYQIADQLTVHSKYDDPVSLAVRQGEHGERMLIPRACAPIGKIDKRTVYPYEPREPLKPAREQEQQDLIDQSLALLKKDISHIIEAPTGFGKSYIGASVALKLGQPTIIIVPKDDLMRSWHKTLVTLMGLKPSEIGIMQANKLKYKGCKVVLAMLQSVIRDGKYSQEILGSFGLAIWDECHRVAADSFIKSCAMIPAKYRLGLSATPERTDGKTPIIHAHIGEVLVVGKTVPMKPKVLIKKTGWRVPKYGDMVDGVKFKKRINVVAGRLMPVFGVMGASKDRNEEILHFVQSCLRQGRTTLILSDLIDGHLAILHQLFYDNGIPVEDMGFYIGGKKAHELEYAANRKIIFATYQMCSEGTDFPQWDTLVLATPRANVKQAVGRVLRRKAGKKQPVILDLVDTGGIFSGFSIKRKQQYFEIGAELIDIADT